MSFTGCPAVLPMRERARVMRDLLRQRLDTILPEAMRRAGLDMWLVICQEDDLDPIFRMLIPPDTWCPILQILAFFDRGPELGVERVNLGMTNTGDLYPRPWTGRDSHEQWELLRAWVAERDPRRIGINTGSVQWCAGGLTHNLHQQLVAALGPELSGRLESAEALVTHWAVCLTPEEVTLHEHVVHVARRLLAWCFSREAITPGVTTTDDLEWTYWQKAADLGLEVSFKPFFMVTRPAARREQYGPDDRVIRPGDLVCSDVGIKYLGLNSDQQQAGYVLQPGETEAPAGLRELMRQANRLQDVYLGNFRESLSGDEMLAAMLKQAGEEGIGGAKVYSHSLSHFLHQPGPLIGLPWEQVSNPGRGEVRLTAHQCFTMELCVRGPVPEWEGEEITLGLEEDVTFDGQVCRVMDGRQTRFHLI